MPKERHKYVEPSVADWLLAQLKQNPYFQQIHQTHHIFDTSTLNEISVLIDNKDGNNINQIINLLETFAKNPESYLNIEEINKVTQVMLVELIELKENIRQHKIKISSALDGYTLNKTCRIIKALDQYINRLKKLSNPSQLKPQRNKQDENRLFSPHRKIQATSTSQHYQKIAENLISACKQIRGQIGSSDSKPRGLVITLTMCLSETLHEASKINKQTQTKILRIFFNLLKNQETSHIDLLGFVKRFYADRQESADILSRFEQLHSTTETDFNLLDLVLEDKASDELCERVIKLLLDHSHSKGDRRLNLNLQSNKTDFEVTKELLGILSTELDHIRDHFPDLAEAGENLQRAIESARLKP